MLTKSGRTIDTVAPVSPVNDVGLPSANPLTIKFPLVLCSVETVCSSGALPVSYTHLDVYKRQECDAIYICLVSQREGVSKETEIRRGVAKREKQTVRQKESSGYKQGSSD